MRKKKNDRVFDWKHEYAQASQWVGVIQIPGLLLEILPKIETARSDLATSDSPESRMRRNLLYMLVVAGELPSREQDLSDVETCRSPLLEEIVRLFAKRLCKELLRGPDRAYVPREENLHCFKGRLHIARHVAVNAAHAERSFCAYDEFSEDTALSRVLKAACSVLHKATRGAVVQEVLRNCLLLLDDAADDPNPVALLERVHITRQNERFRELFGFARLVLLGRTPEPRAGGERTFSLLFDMNALFERFVTRFLQRYVVNELPEGRLIVQGLDQAHYLMLRDGVDRSSSVLRMKPDILITWSGDKRVVIDTKWKMVWDDEERKERVGREDLYQMFAYGHRCQSIRTVLLYPSMEGVPADAEPRRYTFCAGDGNEPDKTGRHLDIAFLDLRSDIKSHRGELAEALLKIVAPDLKRLPLDAASGE